MPGVSSTPIISVAENYIRDALSRISGDEQIDYLVRALAEPNVTVQFERIYRVIFGSQIVLLKKLNMGNAGTEALEK